VTYNVVIEQTAHASIERNALWWATNHSFDESLTWQAAIYEQLTKLQTMPERHGIARENDEFSFELRQQLLGIGKQPTYRVLFTINGSAVHVLEFLAAEQDDWSSST